jgi:membrane protein required for colicin V production
MAWVDVVIVIALAISTIVGLVEGFFRSVCSLGGFFLALVLASWNYAHFARLLRPFMHSEPVADAVAFLLVALVVVVTVNLAGRFLAKAFRLLGLGCLDRIAGAAFGFLQGALLVTLCILVTVAFFPQAHWLTQARLPRMFFGACHLSTHMTPAELADRVRHGLRELEQQSPPWLHPGSGNV